MKGLPPVLSAWSEQLSALRPDVAIALGPMLRRLDELVGRHTSNQGSEGEPDGFDGLTRHGDPHRLLVSQWALAQDAPDEFLRRAANGELLYLERAQRHDLPRGQTALLLDCGPPLQGAGRLAQLVMTLLLHRRATAAGSDLRVGILTAPAGSWLEGDLTAILQAWAASRSRPSPSAEQLRAWLAVAGDPATTWVVTAGPLARHCAAAGARPPRLVTVTESDWTPQGPSAVVVGLAGEQLHLTLPPADVGIRVLRGQGWRQRRADPATQLPSGTGSGLRLLGQQPTLLARGRDTSEIFTQRVPGATAQPGRPRLHQFAGPVLAASVLGGRLVALIAVGSALEARVIGRRLADVHQVSVPLEELELDSAAVAAIATGPPGDVFFRAGKLLVPLGGRWWELSPARSPAVQPAVVAATMSATVDAPVVVWASGGKLWLQTGSHTSAVGPIPADGPVPEVWLGSAAIAWQSDRGWLLADCRSPQFGSRQPGSGQLHHEGIPLPADPGGTMAGVTRINGEVGLVNVGGGGVLVRFITGAGLRTLTRWSGGTGPPAVHPLLPLIAVPRDGGVIEVGDLETGQVRLRVEAGG